MSARLKGNEVGHTVSLPLQCDRSIHSYLGFWTVEIPNCTDRRVMQQPLPLSSICCVRTAEGPDYSGQRVHLKLYALTFVKGQKVNRWLVLLLYFLKWTQPMDGKRLLLFFLRMNRSYFFSALGIGALQNTKSPVPISADMQHAEMFSRRMSCAQLVLAHCGRTTGNRTKYHTS